MESCYLTISHILFDTKQEKCNILHITLFCFLSYSITSLTAAYSPSGFPHLSVKAFSSLQVIGITVP